MERADRQSKAGWKRLKKILEDAGIPFSVERAEARLRISPEVTVRAEELWDGRYFFIYGGDWVEHYSKEQEFVAKLVTITATPPPASPPSN
jgi:G:T-mismatch repair DNA endonuclease (very short patch repair protein)